MRDVHAVTRQKDEARVESSRVWLFLSKKNRMKDILVVGMLNEGQFPKFMSFMQSEEGIAERKKIADLSKTIGTVAPDQRKVMFKIAVHDMDALHAFLNGSNQVSKPVFDAVMDSYEIYELNQI